MSSGNIRSRSYTRRPRGVGRLIIVAATSLARGARLTIRGRLVTGAATAWVGEY